MVKNLPVKAGDTRDVGSIPGLGDSHGVGNGNLLQHACLGKSHGQRATVPGVAKSQTRLSTHTRASMCACAHTCPPQGCVP